MSSAHSTCCPSCTLPKLRNHYLCGTCWKHLPLAARTALYRRDAHAVRRLSSLLEQLRANVPLNEIEIADE